MCRWCVCVCTHVVSFCGRPTPQSHKMSTPLVATVVETGSFARLSTGERQYVRCMKKRDRSGVLRILDNDSRRVVGGQAPLRIQVLQSRLPETIKMQIFEDLRTCTSDKYMSWVRRAVTLPIGVIHTPRYIRGIVSPSEMINEAMRVMNEVVSGHEDAKNEVCKIVCQAVHGGTLGGAYSIGLEGAPGTGKTYFVRNAMARALDRPMVSFQLGGANDVSYLLGQMYTYEGSKEGRLASGLIESGVCNPILYFDEVDKISESDRGREIASVLIHLIDPSSNTAMRDRYFHGIDLDFSKCLFVFSYNDPSRVNPVLLDRIKRIRVHTPSIEERCAILNAHIVPRIAKRLNARVHLEKEALEYVVKRGDAQNEGMRGCEKDVDDIMSQAQLEAAMRGVTDVSVTGTDAKKWCRPVEEVHRPPPFMYT